MEELCNLLRHFAFPPVSQAACATRFSWSTRRLGNRAASRPSVSFVSPSRSHLLPHFARGLPSPPQRAGKKRMPAALLASMFWPAPTLALCQVQRARLTPRPSRPRPKLHPRSSRGRYLCSARGFCTALCLRQPPSAFLVPFSAPARPCAAISARFFPRHILLLSNAHRARPPRPAHSVL